MYVQGNDITLRTKFVLKFEIQKLFFSGVKKGGGGGCAVTLYVLYGTDVPLE